MPHGFWLVSLFLVDLLASCKAMSFTVTIRLSRDSGEVSRSGNQCAPSGRAYAAATMRRFSRRVEARP